MSSPASAEPAVEERAERRRPLRRRVTKHLRRWGMLLVLNTLPYIYVAYMWFVYKTSRVEELGLNPGLAREQLGRGVFAIWHDEVFFIPWEFGKYHPDALTSHGDAGSMYARLLEVCGFTTFRGGSSIASTRRSEGLVEEMVAHMGARPGVIYGFATDGSHGPIYRMKTGAIRVALGSGAPLCVEKTWCRHYLRLPTWDRSLVPLPFNYIVHVSAGPIFPGPDTDDPERVEALREEVEHLLCRVTAWARARAEGKPLPAEWLALFPERYRDEMARAEEPTLFLPTS